MSDTSDIWSSAVQLLPATVKQWAVTISPDQLARILTAFHSLPHTTQTKSLTAQLNPVAAGQHGELQFEKICTTLYGDYTVEYTARTKHAGDFLIRYRTPEHEYLCLVDVKNYRNTVPKKEIEKFDRDLSSGNYDAGLLLSYYSKFTGVTDAVHMTQTETNTGILPVMYVTSNSPDIIRAAIQILCTTLAHKNSQTLHLSRIHAGLRHINESLFHIGATRRLLSTLNTTVYEQITRCQEHLIGYEVQVKQAVRSIEHDINNARCADVGLVDNIPVLEERDDNVGDSQITASEELHAEISSANEACDADVDFDYSLVRDADVPLVQQMLIMDWLLIKQDVHANTAEFYADEISFTLTFMKTKTSVRAQTDSAFPASIISHFTKKSDSYVARLDQRLVDSISEILCTQ